MHASEKIITRLKLPLLFIAAGALGGALAAGCSHDEMPPPATQAAPPAGAPSDAQVAANRDMASQHMKQAHEAAAAAWRQSHPGQPLPPGL